MVIENKIRQKIEEAFKPEFLELVNESHTHNVPPGSESHFRMVLVSDEFAGMNRVQRQRKVNEVIAEELSGPVHAFSQRVMTLEEWEKVKDEFEMKSPDCRGGSKV